jgi:hypothetical protein
MVAALAREPTESERSTISKIFRNTRSPPFKIGLVLVRLDHVPSRIVHANH